MLWSLHPCWAWALVLEPSQRRHSSRREAVARGQGARLQLPRRRSRSNTKAAMEGGEYIKITGMVIAFYINVLFKSFPQCESPSLKRINSLHTNLFRACRWSIMTAPPSTPDQEASGCHLTQLPGLPAQRRCRQQQGPGVCGAAGEWGAGFQETLGLRAKPHKPR